MMQRLFGILIILSTIGLVVHFGGYGKRSQSSLAMSSSSAKLYRVWTQDLRTMKKKEQLPKAFGSIKQVTYIPLSKMSAQWMSGIKAPIRLNSEGRYSLNVEVDHYSKKKRTSAIIHYQLVDIKSGNTVLEFGRTYKIR